MAPGTLAGLPLGLISFTPPPLLLCFRLTFFMLVKLASVNKSKKGVVETSSRLLLPLPLLAAATSNKSTCSSHARWTDCLFSLDDDVNGLTSCIISCLTVEEGFDDDDDDGEDLVDDLVACRIKLDCCFCCCLNVVLLDTVGVVWKLRMVVVVVVVVVGGWMHDNDDLTLGDDMENA